MAINKVTYGNQVLIDLENDTAEASDVVSGQTFHSRSGDLTVGTLDIQSILDRLTALETATAQTGTTLAVNSSVTAGRGGARVRKIGSTVFFTGGIGNATSTVSTTTNLFAQMPAAYRPSSNVTLYGYGTTSSATSECNYTVRTDGYVRQTLSNSFTNGFVAGFWNV